MNPAHERASRIDQPFTGGLQGPTLFVAEPMSSDYHSRGRNAGSAITLLQHRKTERLDSCQHFSVMNQLTVNRRSLRIVHRHDGRECVLHSETHSHCLSIDDLHSNRPRIANDFVSKSRISNVALHCKVLVSLVSVLECRFVWLSNSLQETPQTFGIEGSATSV